MEKDKGMRWKEQEMEVERGKTKHMKRKKREGARTTRHEQVRGEGKRVK